MLGDVLHSLLWRIGCCSTSGIVDSACKRVCWENGAHGFDKEPLVGRSAGLVGGLCNYHLLTDQVVSSLTNPRPAIHSLSRLESARVSDARTGSNGAASWIIRVLA